MLSTVFKYTNMNRIAFKEHSLLYRNIFKTIDYHKNLIHIPKCNNTNFKCSYTVKNLESFLTNYLNRQYSTSLSSKHVDHHCKGMFLNSNKKSFIERFIHTTNRRDDKKNKSVMIYLTAAGCVMLGVCYAGVPLYRLFCQSTGSGGTVQVGHDTSKVGTMTPVKDKKIKIKFNADLSSSMQWNFRPQQTSIIVSPGETALAFYTAKNPTNFPIVGISTYNVLPFEAGAYFNKIQCFCFEEQRLNPGEQVDMPVFFFIDPEFAEDPKMDNVDIVTLSYTFFEAKDDLQLPVPEFLTHPTTLNA